MLLLGSPGSSGGGGAENARGKRVAKNLGSETDDPILETDVEKKIRLVDDLSRSSDRHRSPVTVRNENFSC